MKRLFITLAAGLFAVTTAQARLGWTLEKCIEFYGPNTAGSDKDGTRWQTFEKEGIKITCVFRDNHAVYIRYDFSWLGQPPSVHQIHDLLDKNSLNATWGYQSVRHYDGVRQWISWYAYSRGRKKIIAQYTESDNDLIINLVSEHEREQEADSNPNL